MRIVDTDINNELPQSATCLNEIFGPSNSMKIASRYETGQRQSVLTSAPIGADISVHTSFIYKNSQPKRLTNYFSPTRRPIILFICNRKHTSVI